ncbi:hypothetical protein ACWGH3_38920 [Streptomyces sp. NPDC054884]|nr:hypothetical protein [Streptomyces sp. ME08-AFT2]MDX3312073.1 hypothetical protein [Streptomyces sp. ME08-AFT2]
MRTFSPTAINMIRLDAHWGQQPARPNRTSNLEQLKYRLTA